MSTLGLLMVLACFYPDHIIVYQFIAILDITSHWLQMYRYYYYYMLLLLLLHVLLHVVVVIITCCCCYYYSSLISGKSSHKGSGNALLNIYYSSKVRLAVQCYSHHFLLLYMNHKLK